MEVHQIYQLERFEFTKNENNVNTATIESWEDTAAVTFYGLDGNILYQSSIEKINDDEYPEWVVPFLRALDLIFEVE